MLEVDVVRGVRVVTVPEEVDITNAPGLRAALLQAAADGSPYRMVDTGSDRGIRGGVGTGQHEDAGQREHWATVYARVPDVGAALARATELGGSREYGPMDVAEHMQTGAVRDPAGNVFGVYSRGPH